MDKAAGGNIKQHSRDDDSKKLTDNISYLNSYEAMDCFWAL